MRGDWVVLLDKGGWSCVRGYWVVQLGKGVDETV